MLLGIGTPVFKKRIRCAWCVVTWSQDAWHLELSVISGVRAYIQSSRKAERGSLVVMGEVRFKATGDLLLG